MAEQAATPAKAAFLPAWTIGGVWRSVFVPIALVPSNGSSVTLSLLYTFSLRNLHAQRRTRTLMATAAVLLLTIVYTCCRSSRDTSPQSHSEQGSRMAAVAAAAAEARAAVEAASAAKAEMPGPGLGAEAER
jgi:hypothetical protein